MTDYPLLGDDADLPVWDEIPDQIKTDALDAATNAHYERLEHECLGAWRAGYNFLYVVYHRSPQIALPIEYTPSNQETFPHPDRYRVEQYDLRCVSPDDLDITVG